MSKGLPREEIDTRQLKSVIDDLRCAVITLILVVSLLAGYIILQYLQQPTLTSLNDIRLSFVGAVVVLILLALWLATSKGE